MAVEGAVEADLTDLTRFERGLRGGRLMLRRDPEKTFPGSGQGISMVE